MSWWHDCFESLIGWTSAARCRRQPGARRSFFGLCKVTSILVQVKGFPCSSEADGRAPGGAGVGPGLFHAVFVAWSVFSAKGDVNAVQWKRAGGWFDVMVTSPTLRTAVHKTQCCWRQRVSQHLTRQRGDADAILLLAVPRGRAAVMLVSALHPSIVPSNLKGLPVRSGTRITNSAAEAVLLELKTQKGGVGSLFGSALDNLALCANALSSFCQLPCFSHFLHSIPHNWGSKMFSYALNRNYRDVGLSHLKAKKLSEEGIFWWK